MQAIEIVGRNVLQHVRLGARLQRPRDLVVGVVGRQHDDPRARVALADLPDGLDAFHHRHAQIEQRDVGVVSLERVDRLDAVARFGDDAQIGFLVDDVRDTGSEQRVVVDDQHASHFSPATRVSRPHGLRWRRRAPRRARLRCRSAAR